MKAAMAGGFVWIAILLLCSGHGTARKQCVPEYNTTSSRIPGKINIHLMPHTHDDTGWLKTVDQYYYGSRQDIQLAGVQYVLDTVMYALEKNPDRKFSYAEMSFFTRWWAEQTDANQETVKKLVEDGQLNFLNGGWVQHDEAAAHYVAMIDQTTRGHRFLEETFGYRPRVGWQIDPFGHSSTQAALMAGYLGFDGLFFGRSDYQDLELRKKAKQLEFLWRGAKSFGKEADIFTGSFPTGNYGPPGGFYFDWGNYDPPVQDNVCLTEINVEERVEDFVKAAYEYADLYQDADIYWPMGTDFTYSNAFTWFKNLDKLIHYVNKDGRVNAFYSSPEDYVKVKHDLDLNWPLKTDDFFPYADCETCYWTGYFSSRPASKGFIKAGTSYLQIARQLELLTGTPGASDHLEEATSLLQHHDSITGTEKQHVANDYHKRLAKGFLHAQRFVSKALSHLVYNTKAVRDPEALPHNLSGNAEGDSDLLLLLQQCPQLNISVCEVSLTSSEKSNSFLTVVYNPLAWSRQAPVRVPITSDEKTSWHVSGPDGKSVESQLVPVSQSTEEVQKILHKNGALPKTKGVAKTELVFLADLPPLGYSAFTISKNPSGDALPATVSTVWDLSKDARWNQSLGAKDAIRFNQGNLSLAVSASTGRVISYTSSSGKEEKFGIAGAWYKSSEAKNGGVASGAYIFRPDGKHEDEGALRTVTVHGPVVTEIHSELLDFLSVTIRLWKGQHHAEVEWTAGPIPIHDKQGKEVVIEYRSDLESGGTFQTDSNGREMLVRKLDHRPTWELNVTQPVAGNYYPLTAAISLQGKDKTELSVLVDRAQGGTSLEDGDIEIMLHRRTLVDDIRGVNEPLNETVATCRFCDSPGLIVRGSHFVSLDSAGDAAAHRRHLQQLINDPVLLSFGPAPPSDIAIRQQFSAMPEAKQGLPENVHLVTSKLLEDELVLIRLAHLFQVDEDAGKLAQCVEVNLNEIFGEIAFDSVVEYGLAGAQPLDKIKRLAFKEGKPINNGHISDDHVDGMTEYSRPAPFACQADCQNKDLTISLEPMEIRTFIGKLAKDEDADTLIQS